MMYIVKEAGNYLNFIRQTEASVLTLIIVQLQSLPYRQFNMAYQAAWEKEESKSVPRMCFTKSCACVKSFRVD